MADNEINVEYDKSGVPLPEERDGNGYSVELTQYFYAKLESILNNNEFTQEEINEYNLTERNGRINISTTHKLINYLKSFVKSYTSNIITSIENDIDNKVGVNEYTEKISSIESELSRLDTFITTVKNQMFDRVYPVGSIYMSFQSTDPSTLFGGTWVKLENRFLLGSGSKTVNTTGGEEKHTLTISELPVHNHTQQEHNHGQGDYEGNRMSFLTMTRDTSGMAFGLTGRKINSLPSGDSFIAYTKGDYPATAIRRPTTDRQAPVINNTGESIAHENMPPFVVVHMWRRVL